ncbi:MAG TPA: choice-of-anchor P family protein [Acidimicrobiales bacterium]
MPRPENRRRSRAFFALVAVALLAASAGSAAANAQTIDTSGSSDQPGSQFGAYKLDSHGEGLSFTYNSPGLIPGTPSPLFAASLPESVANMDSGPSSYALSSLVYPGPLIADLPSVLALGGVPQASAIPSYPVRAQAFYPAGPTGSDTQVGTGRQSVNTSASDATATTDYGAAQLPGIVNIGAITSMVDNALGSSDVTSRTHVELSNVDLLAGLFHVDSIVTDLVATSSGSDAASNGTTTMSGVTFLGFPATIDADGVHFTSPPSSDSGAPTTTSPLGALGSALTPAGDGLTQLMNSVIGAGNTNANQLLAQSGIQMKLLQPSEVKSGADASRLASGLLVTITYNGSTEPVLSNLLNLIPIESLPSQGLGPIPFSSPQSLVLALKATHVETIGLAAASVRASASPPFSLPSLNSSFGSNALTGNNVLNAGKVSGGKFTTPAPQLGAGGAGGGGGTIGNALPISLADSGPLAAAVVLMLVALAAGLAAVGGGRLADNVLAAASSSCPEGLDRSPASGGNE